MPTHTTKIYREKVNNPNSKQIYQERVESDSPAQYYYGTSLAGRVIYYILDVLEILLVFRLLFRLLQANPGNAFVNFIYSLTAPFVAPFRGILPSTTPSGVVVEWSTVLAMIVYALIAYAIVRLIDMANINKNPTA